MLFLHAHHTRPFVTTTHGDRHIADGGLYHNFQGDSSSRVMLRICIAFMMVLISFAASPVAAHATKTKDAIPSSTLVGDLGRHFDGCLIRSDHDIDMDCLLRACTKLKDAMFAMGQDGNARDLASNLRKIEHARKQAPLTHRSSLRSLLEYEKEQGVKLAGGRLKNPSAAVGLLWIRRSVAFQRHMNHILLERPDLPATQAALQAYQKELEPYHSWGLQTIYRMAFLNSTPTREVIFGLFRGGSVSNSLMEAREVESLTIQDIHVLLDVWKPLLAQWKKIFESLDMEDINRA